MTPASVAEVTRAIAAAHSPLTGAAKARHLAAGRGLAQREPTGSGKGIASPRRSGLPGSVQATISSMTVPPRAVSCATSDGAMPLARLAPASRDGCPQSVFGVVVGAGDLLPDDTRDAGLSGAANERFGICGIGDGNVEVAQVIGLDEAGVVPARGAVDESQFGEVSFGQQNPTRPEPDLARVLEGDAHAQRGAGS